jgi:hypothetical protein
MKILSSSIYIVDDMITKVLNEASFKLLDCKKFIIMDCPKQIYSETLRDELDAFLTRPSQ